MNEIGNIIKELAKSAVEQDKPVAVVMGKVIENNSLKIETEQKMIIPEDMLIVPKRISVSSLEIDDNVILIRCDGGQRYLVMDLV